MHKELMHLGVTSVGPIGSGLLVHTTSADHLVPSTPSLTDIPPLEVIARYRRDDGFTMTGEGVEVLVGEDPAQAATVVLPIRVGGVVVVDHKPGRR